MKWANKAIDRQSQLSSKISFNLKNVLRVLCMQKHITINSDAGYGGGVLMRGSVAARLLGYRVRIPLSPKVRISDSCECFVLSGRYLCFGLITRPEDFYSVWLYLERDRETSIM
jgi:hypothetical protein